MNTKALILTLCCLAVALSPPPLASQSLDEARRLIEEGEIAEAVAVFRQVAADSDDRAERATAFNNACVLLTRLGRHDEAFEACRQALPLRRQLGDARRLARGLNNTGLALQHLGRYDEAIACYEEALAINESLEDWPSLTINLSNLGFLYTTMGRYEAASRRLDRALELATEHASEPWTAEQRVVARVNYGVLLEKVGAYREALDLYDEIFRDAPDLDPRRRAQLEVNRGVMLRHLGDPVRAQHAFEQAIRVFTQEADWVGLSNAWLNLGLVRYLDLGQLEEAEQALTEALAGAEESGEVAEQVQDHYFLGRLYVDQGRFEAAAAALEACRRLMGHHLEENGDGGDGDAKDDGTSEELWLVDDGLARLARAQGDLPAALEALERALQRIESTRQDLSPAGWRAGYLQDKRSIYVAAVDVGAELARTVAPSEDGAASSFERRAWEVVQRAKARQLLEALGDDAPWPTRRPSTDALAELIEVLGDDVLLELFVGSSRLHAWTLVEGELRWHDAGPAAPLLAAVQRVHGALARGAEPTAEDLSLLSSVLLAGTGVLEGGARHLFVVADGEFRRLPFELLSHGGRRLIESLAVSYLPNASMLPLLRRRRAQQPSAAEGGALRLLALGAPELPRLGDRLAGPGELMRQRFHLAPLPSAASELAMAEEQLAGTAAVLLGASATEEALRRLAPRGRGVVHFATHTLVNDGPQEASAVVLSPGGEDDGMLFPREIATLSLQAPLTVLASCRSGLGDIDGNGALSSLSGAFLAAGSSAVVASLWDVDDQGTAVFMQQLYYQLAQGLAPHEALRQAKLRLLDDRRWDRPQTWGAFVLIGAAPPVVPRRGSWSLWGIVVLAILGPAAYGWLRRRASRRPSG